MRLEFPRARVFQYAFHALVISCVLLSRLDAASILQYGGNYVNSSTPLSGGAPTPVGTDTLAHYYSWTAPKSPSTGYTGPKFYGAFETKAGIGYTPAFTKYEISESTTGFGDRISISGGAGSSSPNASSRALLKGMVFFKKTEFLNGGANADSTVTFDSSSSMTVNVNSLNNAPRIVRMAIYATVDGLSNWYLSESAFTLSTGEFSIGNTSTAKWGLWSGVVDGALLPAEPTTYSLLGSSFDDISAAGLYFYTSVNNPVFTINHFAVDALVQVPEPSTAAMVILFGGGLLWSWKRRAHSQRAA